MCFSHGSLFICINRGLYMGNPIIMFIIIILVLLVIVGLPILLLVLSWYKKQNKQVTQQYTEVKQENTQLYEQYSSVQQNYINLQTNIQQKKEAQKEVAKRRRVKKSDKNDVFERDNYTCQICGISKEFLDGFCMGLGDYLLLEVDHIQSVAQGGTGKDVDNLQCLCWRCNRKKGDKKTNEEVLQLIDYGVDKLISRYKPMEIENNRL